MRTAIWILPLVIAVSAPVVGAQDYPTKPIRMVVPFPPGGATDILARILGQQVSESIREPVVVDNRPGAGGNIGARLAAQAPSDGYTLFICAVGVTISPSIYAKLGYDPVKDFAPVTLVASVPLIVVVHPSLPVNSMQELVGLARSQPGALNYASGGVGTSGHLATELFKSMTGTKMTHIPYKGGGLAVTSVLGGETKVFFAGMPPALPHVKSGKLRPLAVTSVKRFPGLPSVPTIIETGFPNFEADNWHGILVPTGTPSSIVRKLNDVIVRSLQRPDVKAAFTEAGAVPVSGTPEEFGKYIRAEVKKWAKVVKDAQIRVE